LFMTSSSAFTVASGVSAMDCSKARTPTEKAICDDPELMKLDRQLSRDYKELRSTYEKSGHYTSFLQSQADEQKQWLTERDACGTNADCIAKEYNSRLKDIAGYSRVCIIPDAVSTAPTASKGSDTEPPKLAAPKCSPADRVDYGFIKKSEGAMLDFYVPGAFKANIKTGRNLGPRYVNGKQTAMAASGVTVGEGVDLGQQTIANLRRYMEIEEKKYGKPGSVSIENILSLVWPYIGLKKSDAVNALNGYYDKNKSYPTLNSEEAGFISSAVKHGYAEDAAALFNKNAHPKMNFWSLPGAVQTTLTDMKYHSYISSVAQHYYRADWEGAAAEFETLAIGKYAQYKARFQARAQMLRNAIQDQSLPKQGDPCAPKKMPVAFNRSKEWETQRLPRWA
ncbi:hypothetical protein HFV00_13995, partial [Acidithiobacillus sp. VAN18-4]|nr:hypothetical protein [Acidithiobacillus sp. VAN18-2]MBU2800569.1 hypothetical protein [Acidithiobacillus sp. VAN18-4]